MMFKIYDEQNLEDVLVVGSHNYENDEFYLKVEGHNLVSMDLMHYDDTIDNADVKSHAWPDSRSPSLRVHRCR